MVWAIHSDPRFLVDETAFEPVYLATYRSGRLMQKVEAALEQYRSCNVCPRNCKVNRLEDKKWFCRTGRYPYVGSYFPHFGEEDCLRGWKGSGTIFFSLCNLRCQFCQNWDISYVGRGEVVTPERLADMMLELQAIGCHNINFVTPEHVVPNVLEALPLAIEGGLRLPIVYNTSAYDSLESLAHLDGVVDIYMPDFKYWDSQMAKRYVQAEDYPERARQAVHEMYRQVGPLGFGSDGMAKRGLLVRHLVMPGGTAGTRDIMQWIAREISPDTYVNVMDQYRPEHRVNEQRFPEINRPLTSREYQEAVQMAREAGLWRLDQRRPHPLLMRRLFG